MNNDELVKKISEIQDIADDMQALSDLASLMQNAASRLDEDPLRALVEIVAGSIEHYSARSASIWLKAREIIKEVNKDVD